VLLKIANEPTNLKPRIIDVDDDNIGDCEGDAAYRSAYSEARMMRGESHKEADRAGQDARKYLHRQMTEGTPENLSIEKTVRRKLRPRSGRSVGLEGK
jgi:hypothetical protein